MTEIILGSPGCGKTTALLDVLDQELARGTLPDRIGFVSFTRKAAGEAADRARQRFDVSSKDLRYFRTLHSLCFRWLGLQTGEVFDGPQLRSFGDHVGLRVTGRWTEDGTLSGFEIGDRILFMENLARVRCTPLRQQYDTDHDQLAWDQVERTARALREYKEAQGLMDYTDMLQEFVRCAPNLGLEVLLVDEAQDLSRLQWKVVDCLAEGVRRVIVAGDDDQAIYRWAGADVEHLIDLPGEPTVLGRSHRVPRAVQIIADELISRVGRRRQKDWSPRAAEGSVERSTHLADVDLDGDDILLLARNEYLLREQVEPLLRERGIVYERRGHPSIKQSILAAITAWERLRAGGEVSGAEARQVYAHLSSGRGVARGYKSLPELEDDDHVTMEELRSKHGLIAESIWHEALDRLPQDEMTYILAARRRGEKLTKRPRVRVSTIHAAKGGEAEHVVLLTEMAARTYREMEWGGREDEARVWYVAVTRTKERLTIVAPTTRQYYDV